MKRPRLNPRLAKRHRTYAVDEAARLFGVHRNTVQNWLRTGLPALDTRRPVLIAGRDLNEFLAKRRAGRKTRCGPGELYCVRCRAARRPAEGMVDCVILRPGLGNLKGLCPDCSGMMNRRVNLGRLDASAGELEVRTLQAPLHLRDRPTPTVICALAAE